PDNTLYGYWKHGCEMLEPVAALTQSLVFGAKVVGVDDTHVDFLTPGKGGKQRGHLWAAANKGGMIAYWFTESWRAEEVATTLRAAEHFVQVDDYKGYGTLVKLDDDGPPMPVVDPDKRLGCGMHIRRRFERALR